MRKWVLVGVALSAFSSSAFAADIPVPAYKIPPKAAISTDNWYVSIDGAWQNVHLPDYALGLRAVSSPGFDLGVLQSFGQRQDGYFVRGAVGYMLPPGTLNFLGANTRLEIGGLYGHASGSQTATSGVGPNVGTVFLNGSGTNIMFFCVAPVFSCTAASSQDTEYSDWQIHGKVAGDYRIGNVTATPSLALFGGSARNNQSLAQGFTQFLGGVVSNTGTYNATTSMHWTDVGVRAGLDLKVDLTSSVAAGVGGFVGFARRNVSFSGSDFGTDTPGGTVLTGGGTIATSANATPFIANLEGGVAWKWLPTLTVRGFAGLNYDSKVPGIVSPSFAGPIGLGPTRSPAGISFQSETSYYAGGGVNWTF
jgi:hypothetical protein